MVELIAGYLNFAKSYYRKGGQLTSEYAAILHAVLPLKQLYGRKSVDEFGPIAVQAVMAQMVANGSARTTVNQHAAASSGYSSGAFRKSSFPHPSTTHFQP